MATYNKRGYKAPKPEQEEVDTEFDQYNNIDASNSKTAEVFNTLDQGANKMESWVVRNQKIIFGLVGAVAIATLGYVGYDKFIVEPKNGDAANEMFQAQSYYNEALMNVTAKDSLFKLALNGGEGKLGFLGIIENYSGTQSANLAHYYAGTAYLNMNKFADAIKELEKFKSNDAVLAPLALGAIGDAFSELGQHKEALEYYQKAAAKQNSDFTTPRFLYKAGLMALELKDKEGALKNFSEIKNNYQGSAEYRNVDAMIGLAQ